MCGPGYFMTIPVIKVVLMLMYMSINAIDGERCKVAYVRVVNHYPRHVPTMASSGSCNQLDSAREERSCFPRVGYTKDVQEGALRQGTVLRPFLIVISCVSYEALPGLNVKLPARLLRSAEVRERPRDRLQFRRKRHELFRRTTWSMV